MRSHSAIMATGISDIGSSRHSHEKAPSKYELTLNVFLDWPAGHALHGHHFARAQRPAATIVVNAWFRVKVGLRCKCEGEAWVRFSCARAGTGLARPDGGHRQAVECTPAPPHNTARAGLVRHSSTNEGLVAQHSTAQHLFAEYWHDVVGARPQESRFFLVVELILNTMCWQLRRACGHHVVMGARRALRVARHHRQWLPVWFYTDCP